MMKTVEAIVDEKGNVRLLEPVRLGVPRRALVTILFLASLPDGSILNRTRFLESFTQPTSLAGMGAHDVNVRQMGDVAIIHARTVFTLKDGRQGTGRYTDVWAPRSGRWLAVAAHVTRN
jgi:hypothetical protein